MYWVTMSIGAAAIMGLVSVLDKIVLSRYIRSALTMPVLLGIVHGGIGVIVLFLNPFPKDTLLQPIGWAFFSGLIAASGGSIFLRTLYYKQVSRALPTWNSFPIFAALIAIIFLDEQVSLYHWMAIIVTLSGSILLSIRRDEAHKGNFLDSSFYLLLVASILQGLAYVTGKVALGDLSVIHTYGIRGIAIGFVLISVNLRSESLQEIRYLFKRVSPALIMFAISVGLVNVTRIMILSALSMGPVALVTTMITTHSLFVFIYSTFLSVKFKWLMNEGTSSATILSKGVSIALIVGGVAFLSLNEYYK